MLQQFKNHIQTHFPFLEGKKLLVAVSGGIDSMVLLHLLKECSFSLVVAHCNFQLRNDESDGDAQFVMTHCHNHQIPVILQKFDTKKMAKDHKLSTQMAARELRYNWFSEILKEKKCDYLLTAHHLDDEVETFLLNIIRGTGLEGLQGIPAQNGNIIRPLLIFSRVDIENFANTHQISWRDDSSNASDTYFRNQLRHQIIPVFKTMNPGFLSVFQNTLQYLQQSQSLVDDAITIVYKKVVQDLEEQKIIILQELLQLPNYQSYLYQWLKPLGFTAWEDIYDIVYANSGKQIFSKHYRLLKDRDVLIVSPITTALDEQFWIMQNEDKIDFPIRLTFSIVEQMENPNLHRIFIDNNSLKFPLLLRKWQEGDYFYPLGMQGRKKISKYFKDEKFTLIDKENTWLLCSGNQIVWVVGKQQDDRFKILPSTSKILKIELQ